MNHETKARIVQVPGSYLNEVMIFNHMPDGGIEILAQGGEALEYVKYGEYPTKNGYTFKASDTQLKALYESLRTHFRVGHDETYVDGKLEQTEKHLNDMRVIALSNLKLEKHI